MKKTLLVIILIVLLTLTLCACKDTEVEPVVAVDIATTADFLAMDGMTGEEYADTVFTLKDNLTVADFTGIYKSTSTPFKGTFDGQGKTISLTYAAIPEEGYLGLFGTLKDATVKDLNISLTVPDTLTLNETMTAIGGIAGLTMGDVNIDNVQVSLNIAPKISKTVTIIETYKDGTTNEEWTNNNVEYVGGIVGSSGGNLTIKGCTVTLNVVNNTPISHKFTRYNDVYVNTVFAGGVVGSVVEGATLSVDTTTVSSMTANVIAESLFIGGMVGDGADVTIKENCVATLATRASALTKGYVGGIAGYLKNSTVKGSTSTMTFVGSLKSTHLNVGGIVGYLDADIVEGTHLSVVEDCTSTITAQDLYRVTSTLTSTASYGVGYLKNSLEKGCVLYGTIATDPAIAVSSSWGDKCGVAYGSATVETTTFSGTNHVGDGTKVNHVSYDDDGVPLPPIIPSI